MGRLTYTAKREMEKTGYIVNGVDISVASGDDSFNSSTTSLLGLLNDQWIQVSGFSVNAVNNGWFQASADSVLHKIAQDTTPSLITEAAGQPIVITGYRRGLGQQYDVEFLSEKSDRSVKTIKTENQAAGGGAPEVIVDRDDVLYSVTVLGPNGNLLDDSTIKQWRELLASVRGGEPFVFDRYGTIVSPDDPRSVVLASSGYDESRVAGTRQYTLSFDLLLI